RNFKNVAFCFLDADKDTYMDCYEAIVPNLVSGGILVADNIISHESELRPFVQQALADQRVACYQRPDCPAHGAAALPERSNHWRRLFVVSRRLAGFASPRPGRRSGS